MAMVDGVTISGIKTKYLYEKHLLSLYLIYTPTNNLKRTVHCGTTQLPHRGTLFIIIFLYFADFRSDFSQNLYGGT